ncbi:hypothetical protein BD410DRAFT_792173 [Rickenella mellea]|uniref:BRCT domain-containing protein n=1 Tax=Rickenella mellea TaxID=50990 RepID=A0A4Y7PVD3_9AGAM|nr:hypothetical protein BD410DRAFT_792173 [Rickenella mellea]
MLFSDVNYHISSSLGFDQHAELSNILNPNGAVEAKSIPEATHIITNSTQFEGWQGVPTNAVVVSDEWVIRSLLHGKQQDPKLYSADPKKIFSGVVATTTEIEDSDKEVIAAGINALGGLFRQGLTRDCTHLLTPYPGSDKYNAALDSREYSRIKIVLPHWFDDCYHLLQRLDETPYEWPDPPIFHKRNAAPGERTKSVLSTEQKTLFKSVINTKHVSTLENETEKDKEDEVLIDVDRSDVWGDRRILLSRDMELSARGRASAELSIQRAGGTIVRLKEDDDEAQKVEGVDVFVCRYRLGAAFAKAFRAQKTIGTLAWLMHVQKTQVLTRPEDHLLHYPTPSKKIDGFEKHIFTVTNYTGEARDYLKQMVAVMGAEFTAMMSGKNTVVIAASLQGEKTTKAREWSLPIVNHLWLEDCFIQWRNLTPANEKYIRFPQGMDFGKLLGERGVGRVVISDVEIMKELEKQEVEDAEKKSKAPEKDKAKPHSSPTRRSDRGGPLPSANSARDAREVEDVVELLDDEPLEEQKSSPRRSTRGSPSKGTKRPAQLDSDEGSERRPAKKREGGGKSKGNYESDGEDERKVKTTSSQTPRKTSPERKKGRRRHRRHPDEDEESEDEVLLPRSEPRSVPSSSKAKGKAPQRATRSTAMDEEEESEDEIMLPKGKPQSSVGGKKGRHQVREEEEETVRQPKKTTSRAAARRRVEEEGEEEEDDDEPVLLTPVKVGPPRGKKAGPSKDPQSSSSDKRPGPTPKRMLSVLLDPLPKSASKSGSPPKGPLHRTRSEHASAAEERSLPSSPPKRAKPDARTPTPSGSEDSAPSSRPGPSNMSSGSRASMPYTLQRTPSKRSAASKANQKLREEVMPDVVNFQKEMKRGNVRGTWEEKGVKKEHDVENGKGDGKRRRASDTSGIHDESEDNEVREIKKRKTTAKGKKRASEDESEDDEDRPTSIPDKPRAGHGRGGQETKATKGKKVVVERDRSESISEGEGSPTDPRLVKIMTTQVELSDDVFKALVKMGMKFTTKANECTHLIANNIARTEKFLCAMSHGPYIVMEKWAVNSVAAKRVMPERQYALVDAANEQKYRFKLSEALERARSSKDRVLEGHTFYVTPSVSLKLNYELLKKFAASAGAKATTQTPTIRLLEPDDRRHVISCLEDKSIWRHLAEKGYSIYGHELLLTGILTQRMEWDNPAFILQHDS